MKRASVVVFCTFFMILLFSASLVHAGGFALYEWSTRGVAMATTGYAQAGDASIIATNPALMTKLEGKNALAGFTLVTPQASVYLDGDKNKTKANTYTVPHAYYTQQMESNENVWLGVGVFTRFGLGTSYDEDWIGKSSLQHVEVQSVSVNPNIAFKFSDKLSVAVGVEILRGTFDMQRFVGSEITFKTEGYGVGGNIGVTYDINDELTAGFTWRAPMRLYTSGSADYDFAGIHSDDGQEISATLPGSYTLGLAYKPNKDWIIEGDVIHTRWESTDKITYGGTIESETALHYKNAWRFQLGAEYWAKEWLALRAGYAYDQTPTRSGDASFMLPVNDRQLFSTGLGFKLNNWNIDWSFMYVVAKERHGIDIEAWDVDFQDGRTWVSGLSVGYSF
ncbi:OmpP1/FadL family transporter [Pseudodesulfovibrio piezophilus]|uniref:Membrane protein involved in aromatic hydrocarbon degradation n=1 Tax=Pseudodesulfovibrio piezophilus (strain DSM 21447 / JCM 15486 / C1TLV30) TaxID=1322246 RepID=M1WLM5_PSEP2|nr:outer membrane protein transport protein [Pseudodesulfovibrio piezophilus]CCH48120.1 Membrane protein involved in aromatic hydrocarbon degradation [Pseudodesulfovibrio piezophilus C1TLV30]